VNVQEWAGLPEFTPVPTKIALLFSHKLPIGELKNLLNTATERQYQSGIEL